MKIHSCTMNFHGRLFCKSIFLKPFETTSFHYQNLKLEAIGNVTCATNNVLHTQNIGPYSSNTNLGTIAVTLPPTAMFNFTANVKNCNNQPVTNGYLSMRFANGSAALALTDMSGMVNISLAGCGGTTIGYSYMAVDLSNNNYSNVVTGAATSTSVALGNVINTSGVYIAGRLGKNAVLWKDGMPTFLTNYPAGAALRQVVKKRNGTKNRRL